MRFDYEVGEEVRDDVKAGVEHCPWVCGLATLEGTWEEKHDMDSSPWRVCKMRNPRTEPLRTEII